MVQCRFSPRIQNLVTKPFLRLCLEQGRTRTAQQVARAAVALIQFECTQFKTRSEDVAILRQLADAYRVIYSTDMGVLDLYNIRKAPDDLMGLPTFDPAPALQRLGLTLLPFLVDPTRPAPASIATMLNCLSLGQQTSQRRVATAPNEDLQRILHHIILRHPRTTMAYRFEHSDHPPDIGLLYGKKVCTRTMLHVVLFVEAVRALPALLHVVRRHYWHWDHVQRMADTFTYMALIGDAEMRTAGLDDYVLHHRTERPVLAFRFRHPYTLISSLDATIYPVDDMWSLIRQLPAAHPFPAVFLRAAKIPPLPALTRTAAQAWLAAMTEEQARWVVTLANLAAVRLEPHTLQSNAMLLSPDGALAGAGIAASPAASSVALCLRCRILSSPSCHVIVELHGVGYHCSRCQSQNDIVFVDLLACLVHNFTALGTTLTLCYECHGKSLQRLCPQCQPKLPEIRAKAQQRQMASCDVSVCLAAHRMKISKNMHPIIMTKDGVPFVLCDFHAKMHPYLLHGDFNESDVCTDIETRYISHPTS